MRLLRLGGLPDRRAAGLADGGKVGEQLARVPAQGAGHVAQGQDADVDQAALDHAPVAAVDPGTEGEGLLRVAGIFACLPQPLAHHGQERIVLPADVAPS